MNDMHASSLYKYADNNEVIFKECILNLYKNVWFNDLKMINYSL